jgi:outer membrane protein assembly factor BamB
MQKLRWVQIALILLVFTQLCPTLKAYTIDEWPSFRCDSNHSGYATGNILTNSALPLWNYTTRAPIVSSPAIVKGEVFVGSKDSKLYCLNASSGQLVWSFATGAGVESSPAVSNCCVYVGSNDGWLYCLNKTNGMPVWISIVGGVVASSPLVVDNFVFIGSGNQDLFCFNASDGSLCWKFPTAYRVDSSPAFANGVIYVATDDFFVYALNASTGRQIWKQHTGSVSSSPSLVDGYVYIGSNDGYVCSLNSSNGEKLWSYQTQGCVVSSPAVAYGCVFVGSEDNNVYCLNMSSGAKIWQSSTGYWVDSSPVVFSGNVYVGSEDYRIYCFNASTGKRQWSWETGDFVDSSPSIVNGVLYFGSCDCRIYAFTLNDSSNENIPIQTPVSLSWATMLFDVFAGIVFFSLFFAGLRFVYSHRQTMHNTQIHNQRGKWFLIHSNSIFILIILGFSTVFFLNLANGPLWISDEQTYSQWAYHMVKSGDYVTPYAFGDLAVWIGKPPLYMWLISLGYQVFGVSNFVTRIWSPIFAVLTMVSTYFLGRQLYNRYVGFGSAMVLGTFATFYLFARHAMTDVPFVFFVVASIYFFVSSQNEKKTNWGVALSGLFFGLALLTKQVEALLIPLIILAYVAISKKNLRFLFTKRFTLFWGIGFSILLPWLTYMFVSFGSTFWDWFVVYCGFTRTLSPLEGHGGSYLFYFNYLLQNEQVWAILLPFAAGFCVYKLVFERSKTDVLLLAWIGIVFLVFTLAQTKLSWYILPAYPAFALAISSLLYHITKKFAGLLKRA